VFRVPSLFLACGILATMAACGPQAPQERTQDPRIKEFIVEARAVVKLIEQTPTSAATVSKKREHLADLYSKLPDPADDAKQVIDRIRDIEFLVPHLKKFLDDEAKSDAEIIRAKIGELLATARDAINRMENS